MPIWAGCVTEAAPGSGSGTITSVNGKPDSGGSARKSSIDGAATAPAGRGTVISLGDTISLRQGS